MRGTLFTASDLNLRGIYPCDLLTISILHVYIQTRLFINEYRGVANFEAFVAKIHSFASEGVKQILHFLSKGDSEILNPQKVWRFGKRFSNASKTFYTLEENFEDLRNSYNVLKVQKWNPRGHKKFSKLAKKFPKSGKTIEVWRVP